MGWNTSIPFILEGLVIKDLVIRTSVLAVIIDHCISGRGGVKSLYPRLLDSLVLSILEGTCHKRI